MGGCIVRTRRENFKNDELITWSAGILFENGDDTRGKYFQMGCSLILLIRLGKVPVIIWLKDILWQ
jgi:hypothetical protein